MGWRRLGAILADQMLSWNWSISRKVMTRRHGFARPAARGTSTVRMTRSIAALGKMDSHLFAALPAQAA
jgi:hypothetical protein